jgi:hypothetical protein
VKQKIGFLAMPKGDALARLSKWYAAQCDGEWEHGMGVAITTVDNPGWLVKINLQGTGCERGVFRDVKINNGDNDWLQCSVKDAKFIGAGDPSKLEIILDHFLSFVST